MGRRYQPPPRFGARVSRFLFALPHSASAEPAIANDVLGPGLGTTGVRPDGSKPAWVSVSARRAGIHVAIMGLANIRLVTICSGALLASRLCTRTGDPYAPIDRRRCRAQRLSLGATVSAFLAQASPCVPNSAAPCFARLRCHEVQFRSNARSARRNSGSLRTTSLAPSAWRGLVRGRSALGRCLPRERDPARAPDLQRPVRRRGRQCRAGRWAARAVPRAVIISIWGAAERATSTTERPLSTASTSEICMPVPARHSTRSPSTQAVIEGAKLGHTT